MSAHTTMAHDVRLLPLDLKAALDLPLQERAAHFVVRSEGTSDCYDEHHVMDSVKKSDIFLTESRKEFLRIAINNVLALDKVDDDTHLRGRGYNSIIIAPSGCGKSFLLKRLIDVARMHTVRTFFCHLNYRVSQLQEPPSIVFASELAKVDRGVAEYFALVVNFDEFHALLKHLKYRVVFVVDDIEFVFGMKWDVGDAILSELVHIGEMDGDRTVLAYITGSTLKVRRFCFVQLLDEEESDYPSYCAVRDFNSTKYGSVVLDPIQTYEEFQCAMRCLGYPMPPDGLTQRHLFLRSRGVARTLISILHPGSTISASREGPDKIIRDDEQLQTIWKALFVCLQSVLHAVEFDEFARRLTADVFSATGMPDISFADLAIHYSRMLSGTKVLTRRLVWDYADHGLLKVRVHGVSNDAPMTIAFNHAADFEWCVRHFALIERVV